MKLFYVTTIGEQKTYLALKKREDGRGRRKTRRGKIKTRRRRR